MNLRIQVLAIYFTHGIGLATRSRIIQLLNQHQLPEIYPWQIETVLGFVKPQQRDKVARSYPIAVERALNCQEKYITYFDEAYPQRLREIFQPPLVLFYRGNIAALKLPSLSVVGTRQATMLGQQAIRYLLPAVIHSGIAIVSGLAQGIDTMSHQMTFAQNGVPIAVIGTGLNVVYPRSNQWLQQHISDSGLLLSEYSEDSGPHRSHFPERNRIIAGLSSATLVIEAKKRSGSLITANVALQNNRDVLAVPGSIFSDNAEGTNELLSLGAKLVAKPQDIIESVQLLDRI